MTELTRESYVERELTKWRENYIIGLEQEFMVKAMFELQYQFNNTPDEHVKAKKDLIETIQRILHNLRLKPALNKERFKVLVIVNSDAAIASTYTMFQKLLFDKIPTDQIEITGAGRVMVPEITTKDFDLKIIKGNINLVRGMRADYILNLTGNKEIDEYFRNQNKL